jgi:thiol-disulfide isomerase/thioredoxin
MKKYMKPLLMLLLLLSATSACFAQQKKKTTLRGQILNSKQGFFILRNQGRADSVKLGPEGHFELFIEQEAANYFTIEQGKQSVQIYVLPDDEMNVIAGSQNLLNATIAGKGAPYCNYLLEKQKADRADMANYASFKLATISGDRYYAIRDSIKAERNNKLTSASKTGAFDQDFRKYEQATFDYQMGYELLQHKTQASKAGISVFPESTERYMLGLDLNNEQVSYDFYFKSFALNRMTGIAGVAYYAGTDKSILHYYELAVEAICTEMKSEKNKSILFSEFMPQLINDVGTSDLRKIIASMEGCCSDQVLIANVKKFAAQFEHLYAGKPAPDAAFYDANGKTSKLSDYKGKVVYIDAWATWCGPCKREIPHLKTLEEEYHGKNVQFISVSTDKDVNAWKNFIAKEQMGGLQLHQSDDPRQSISQLYIVNSIPRFILIDEKGNIVNTDAPRPSSGDQIRNVLNELLAD